MHEDKHKVETERPPDLVVDTDSGASQVAGGEALDSLFGPLVESPEVTRTKESSRKFGGRFIGIIAFSALLIPAIVFFESQLISMSTEPRITLVIGACLTFMGMVLAVAVALVRLYYPAGRRDFISLLLWLLFNLAVSSSLFGIGMSVLGLLWSVYPTLLFNELRAYPIIGPLIERVMSGEMTLYAPRDFTLRAYISFWLLMVWPFFAAGYCLLRWLVGVVWRLLPFRR